MQNLPIKHLSFSAIREYCQNRQSFFKKYIRKEFDDESWPSLVEWNIFHEIVAEYWFSIQRGEEADVEALKNNVMTKHFEQWNFDKVRWWKTWSLEKSVSVIDKLVQFYFEEIDKMTWFDEIVEIEQNFIERIYDLDDNVLPVPFKWKTDRIVKTWWNLIVDDWKSVTSFTDPSDVYEYELQAAWYWLWIRVKYWINPFAARFFEIKKSKNKDWSSQINVIYIEFTPQMINRFIELYSRIVDELSGKPLIDLETWKMRFVPNPFVTYGGESAWKDFCDEVDNNRSWNVSQFMNIQKPEPAFALDL